MKDTSPTLHTARLLLRPLRPADAAAVAALANDWDVVRMTGTLPFPYRIDDAYRFIDRAGRRGPLEWAVVTDRLIGCIGAGKGLGYVLGRVHWGQGYATEAATAALDAYFARPLHRSIAASANPENAASLRVLEKLGFVRIGQSLKPCKARGHDCLVIDMALSREAWRAATARPAKPLPTRSSQSDVSDVRHIS